MHLGTSINVEDELDERFQVGDTVNRIEPIGESILHVCQGSCIGGGHGNGVM